MKKSLKIALEGAKQYSIKCPDVKVHVMDKPKKEAISTASEWVYKERVLIGYHTVATFVNGKKI